MNSEEQRLIENLFVRFHKTEHDFPNRDNEAEKLISDLFKKYSNVSYYMVQTILIQETAIKKLSEKNSELEKKISLKETDIKDKSSGFLSGLFKSKKKLKNYNSQKLTSDNCKNTPSNLSSNTGCNNGNLESPSNFGRVSSPVTGGVGGGYTSAASNVSSPMSSFLSGSLQTAAGVAGGMVMANVLMNLFQNKRPEEEIISHISRDDFSPVYVNSENESFSFFNSHDKEDNFFGDNSSREDHTFVEDLKNEGEQDSNEKILDNRNNFEYNNHSDSLQNYSENVINNRDDNNNCYNVSSHEDNSNDSSDSFSDVDDETFI